MRTCAKADARKLGGLPVCSPLDRLESGTGKMCSASASVKRSFVVNAAIAGMRVAPKAGVHAGTAAGGRLMAPVTHPDIVNPRIVAFLRARG
jgi:hypothetical protein